MKPQQKLSLFIFRRDLRLHDNTALKHALAESEQVIPCFIFDPRQVTNKNAYHSANALQFMIESLQDLDAELGHNKAHLYTFYGIAENIVEDLLENYPIEAVYFNKDYTPFSRARDKAIAKICKKKNAVCFSFDDALLIAPENFLNKTKQPYKVFTPFFKAASQQPVAKPSPLKAHNFYTKNIKIPTIQLKNEGSSKGKIVTTKNPNIAVHGGRSNACKILNKIGDFKNYKLTHDHPSLSTTHLSAHLKFGTISVREVFYAIEKKLGKQHPLIRQLYWRDFFTYIGLHFPHVFGQAFKEKYDDVQWSWDAKKFKNWCEGTTGFPIVDAGMRQLNKTGFMHNRVRMIVASFLVKDLHIDWREGEKYFAQQLVDYDPAVNNGNWQWCASTGADAQPYFRIFNPWNPQKKFDKNCEYIKTWIPELKDIPSKTIHNLFKETVKNYPQPIVDHAKERIKALKTYKALL